MLAVRGKVVLKVEDLEDWIVTDVEWSHGGPTIWKGDILPQGERAGKDEQNSLAGIVLHYELRFTIVVFTVSPPSPPLSKNGQATNECCKMMKKLCVSKLYHVDFGRSVFYEIAKIVLCLQTSLD